MGTIPLMEHWRYNGVENLRGQVNNSPFPFQDQNIPDSQIVEDGNIVAVAVEDDEHIDNSQTHLQD